MIKRNAKTAPKPGKAGNSRNAQTITYRNAAGIDVGSASHYVVVPPNRDDEPVREFPGFTSDHTGSGDAGVVEGNVAAIRRVPSP